MTTPTTNAAGKASLDPLVRHALANAKPLEYGFAMMDKFPVAVQRDYLVRVLRGRRRFYKLSINCETVVFRRSDIRDYLRTKYPDVKAHVPNSAICLTTEPSQRAP